MNHHEHALEADRLLRAIDTRSEQLQSLTPDERLQMTALGGFKRENESFEWTLQLAIAHALTALALRPTDGDE